MYTYDLSKLLGIYADQTKATTQNIILPNNQ